MAGNARWTGIDDHSRFMMIARIVVANGRAVCETFAAAMEVSSQASRHDGTLSIEVPQSPLAAMWPDGVSGN
jgi:hypothetical protein